MIQAPWNPHRAAAHLFMMIAETIDVDAGEPPVRAYTIATVLLDAASDFFLDEPNFRRVLMSALDLDKDDIDDHCRAVRHGTPISMLPNEAAAQDALEISQQAHALHLRLIRANRALKDSLLKRLYSNDEDRNTLDMSEERNTLESESEVGSRRMRRG